MHSIQRLCWRKIYLETIEVVDPACSVAASCWKAVPGGFVRPELTFSLVLTPRILTDRTGKGKGVGKKTLMPAHLHGPPAAWRYREAALSSPGKRPAVILIRPVASGLGRGFTGGYPQHSMKNAPKMHSDITVAKVVVHISCADCHGAVIQPSSAVGACNQNLSQ